MFSRSLNLISPGPSVSSITRRRVLRAAILPCLQLFGSSSEGLEQFPQSPVAIGGFGRRGSAMKAGFVWGLACVASTMAALPAESQAAPLSRFTGSFSASGTVVLGPSATEHHVNCDFRATSQGDRSIVLRGTCRAYLIISRAVAADLVLAPDDSRVTGTYTGARVGPASLSGRMRGNAIDLVITWPQPVYGDTRAAMRIVSPSPDQMRITVTDRIGAGGPMRTTTDLTLTRRGS